MYLKLVDLHADIGYDVIQKRKAKETNILQRYHVEKWKKGEFDTICMASYFEGHETWDQMKEMILALKEEIYACDDVVLVQKKEDFHSTKIKAVLSVEGMCGIKDQEEACIDWLHEQGIVMASLTWNDENYLATGVKGNPNRGLSEAGIRVVQRMEKHHMIIDVSHANEKTFWDIIDHTKGTIVATHSNVNAICDHRRNLHDDQIRAIAKRGGFIGAVAAPWFVDVQEQNWNVEHLIKHLEYIYDMIGINHIALGFDFMDFYEGYEKSYVKGLRNASEAQNMVFEMQKSFKKNTDIEKIAYQNAINILKKSFI